MQLRATRAVPAFSVTDLEGRIPHRRWASRCAANFWAGWSALRANPGSSSRFAKYRDHLVIVGISEDEPPLHRQTVATAQQMHYPIVMSTEPSVRSQEWGRCRDLGSIATDAWCRSMSALEHSEPSAHAFSRRV